MVAPTVAFRETVISTVLIVQEFTLLSMQAIAGIAASRRYIPEIILQIERVGVGSLFIVILTGLFTGMVLTL
jgi:phospholipid/cholesterol/gamma-HCH transport system permease protein